VNPIKTNLIGVNVNDNIPMVRPTLQDRDSIALIHVRISLKTKELLDRLKLEEGYKTYDQALLSVLFPRLGGFIDKSAKPLTINDLLKRSDVNKLIGETSRALYHNHVKPGSRPKQSKQSNKGRTRKNKSW
jgi:hypothetical protein